MWPFKSKPKHKHTWKTVSCAYYTSITGPRTVISQACIECHRVQSENVPGVFKVSDFN